MNKPIKNLKITYKNQIYDKVLYFNVVNTNEYNKYEVWFTNQESENTEISINCMLKDIDIETK